jgi:hypothetical protein
VFERPLDGAPFPRSWWFSLVFEAMATEQVSGIALLGPWTPWFPLDSNLENCSVYMNGVLTCSSLNPGGMKVFWSKTLQKIIIIKILNVSHWTQKCLLDSLTQ